MSQATYEQAIALVEKHIGTNQFRDGSCLVLAFALAHVAKRLGDDTAEIGLLFRNPLNEVSEAQEQSFVPDVTTLSHATLICQAGDIDIHSFDACDDFITAWLEVERMENFGDELSSFFVDSQNVTDNPLTQLEALTEQYHLYNSQPRALYEKLVALFNQHLF